jgi:hypothetical protein
MVVNGFYKTRIVHILLQSENALNTNEIWERFHAAYYHELNMLPGKTKLASVQSAISRLANNKDIVRMLDQSSENVLYKYYIKHKHSYDGFQIENMRSEASYKKKKTVSLCLQPYRKSNRRRYSTALHRNAVHILYSLKMGQPP